MDKLILVLYVDVGGLENDVDTYVNRVASTLFPEDVIAKLEATTFVIPRIGGGTVIECINPNYVIDSASYRNFCLKMDELNEYVSNFIEKKKEDKNG